MKAKFALQGSGGGGGEGHHKALENFIFLAILTISASQVVKSICAKYLVEFRHTSCQCPAVHTPISPKGWAPGSRTGTPRASTRAWITAALQLLPHTTQMQKLAQLWRVRIVHPSYTTEACRAFTLQVCHTISDPQRFKAIEAVWAVTTVLNHLFST